MVKWFLRTGLRKWLLLPPIVVGVAVVVLLRLQRSQPEPAAQAEAVRVLRMIRAPVVDVVPRVIGYGTAEPQRVWQAVAEVKGRVVETHPELEPGTMVKQGEILLRIDPKEYELGVARLQADVEQIAAELEQLAIQQANDQALVELEASSLKLAEAQLNRLQLVRESNSVSASELDEQQRAVLAQLRKVQSLRNSLRLVPQKRKSLEAAQSVKQANLDQARLDLAKTTITAPFGCRISGVTIVVGQFVATGQSLFEVHGTDVTEVEAQIPLDQLSNLIDPKRRMLMPVNMDAATVKRLFDFEVTVRYGIGDFRSEWEGRVVRMREQIEPQTHTIGLVVAVDKPYEQAIPGKRPPLVQGMFCEVELRSAPRKGCVVVPRLALHNGHVYVIDDENRLRRRKVDVAFAQSNFLCLRTGLGGGECVVVSDPAPAIEGMLVEPIEDRVLADRMVAEARGTGAVK